MVLILCDCISFQASPVSAARRPRRATAGGLPTILSPGEPEKNTTPTILRADAARRAGAAGTPSESLPPWRPPGKPAPEATMSFHLSVSRIMCFACWPQWWFDICPRAGCLYQVGGIKVVCYLDVAACVTSYRHWRLVDVPGQGPAAATGVAAHAVARARQRRRRHALWSHHSKAPGALVWANTNVWHISAILMYQQACLAVSTLPATSWSIQHS